MVCFVARCVAWFDLLRPLLGDLLLRHRAEGGRESRRIRQREARCGGAARRRRGLNGRRGIGPWCLRWARARVRRASENFAWRVLGTREGDSRGVLPLGCREVEPSLPIIASRQTVDLSLSSARYISGLLAPFLARLTSVPPARRPDCSERGTKAWSTSSQRPLAASHTCESVAREGRV